MVACPVPLAQRLGDNEIETLAQRLIGRVPENALGGAIPKTYDALPVGKNNCLVSAFDDPSVQLFFSHRPLFQSHGQTTCQQKSLSGCTTENGVDELRSIMLRV